MCVKTARPILARAAITGDFVLKTDEVNPVLQTLRSNGIEVMALHSHMLREGTARLFSFTFGQMTML